MAVAGDWLQGPHVYALYQSYGMSKHQIELLFIAGFGSSLLFGTVIGSFADKFGRRNCVIYGILYGCSCITKHFASIEILMVGRFLGGIATSILYSAFESWLVYEHNKRGFSENLLGTIFSHAALGNSLIAILSGVAAQFAADAYGFVAPFDLSLMPSWPVESYSYGNMARITADEARLLYETHFSSKFATIKNTSYLVEMYGRFQATFAPIPHGYIFASFMVATMMGSSIFKLLSKTIRPESFMRYVLLVSAVCLGVPVVMPNSAVSIFLAFLVFEVIREEKGKGTQGTYEYEPLSTSPRRSLCWYFLASDGLLTRHLCAGGDTFHNDQPLQGPAQSHCDLHFVAELLDDSDLPVLCAVPVVGCNGTARPVQVGIPKPRRQH
ncbi:hypothetical protein OSTOST_11783, partial [Ostertagia ostertagi]